MIPVLVLTHKFPLESFKAALAEMGELYSNTDMDLSESLRVMMPFLVQNTMSLNLEICDTSFIATPYSFGNDIISDEPVTVL